LLPPTVAIIGAGPLGRWLALAAARAGFRVSLEDVMPANLHHAQEFLRQQLGPHQLPEKHIPVCKKCQGTTSVVPLRPKNERGALAPAENLDLEGGVETEGGGGFNPRIEHAKSKRALAPEGHVAFVSTIEEAVRHADLVIDCVPDELESKLEILWLLDRMAPPRTVLATPTTRLSITDLASCTYRPAKCIAIASEASTLTGNPQAGTAASREIQLRTTTQTAPETVALLDHFWRQLGFTPVFAPDPAEPPSN
jgi:3-hydroxybutyryl-CoA dehydrogenase